jgi:hypothetical protein
MTKETIATLCSLSIPLVLLGLGALIQKIVEGQPFRRRHFFLGLDLSIYFLTACMVNFLDLARKQPPDAMSIIRNVLLLLAGIVMLIIQIAIHQTWMRDTTNGKMQVFMLCYFANGIVLLLLYGFVILKAGGLI